MKYEITSYGYDPEAQIYLTKADSNVVNDITAKLFATTNEAEMRILLQQIFVRGFHVGEAFEKLKELQAYTPKLAERARRLEEFLMRRGWAPKAAKEWVKELRRDNIL